MNTVEDRFSGVFGVDRRVTRLEEDLAGLKLRGPGGTSGGVTEDWKVSVDRQLEQLHTDVRNLLYGLIASFLILAGGGWAAYDKLSDQMTALRVEQAKAAGEAETRSATLNGKIDLLLERKGEEKPPK